MSRNSQLKIFDESFIEDDYNELPPTDVIAYNELRSCSDLYRMYSDGILDINPDFQRDEVWSDAQKTRFIDSLIKKLPIPSMCFSLDYKTEKWQVIDGLQRISSIIKFLDEESNWQLSKLKDIDTRLSGKYVSDVKNIENGLLYTRLRNLSIPITVIRCDYSNNKHSNYLFTIFHRLNTGGVKLTNQEIRNAIFNGRFNSVLKECNKNKVWRKLISLDDSKKYRLSKEELILRFFSFYDNKSNYSGSLTSFLNNYMSANINPDDNWVDSKLILFENTINLLSTKLTNGKPLERNSNVIIEALLYGVAKNLLFLESKSSAFINGLYKKLLAHDNFSEVNLREGLATKAKVLARLDTAKKIFSGNRI